MKFVPPSYEILTAIDGQKILKAIERAGRTAYKSEGLIKEGSAEKFVRKIVHELKHESVIEHESVSVKFICDRGVSHEIVRHRLASYTQESTRYCNYGKDKFGNSITFIMPPWINLEDAYKILNYLESDNKIGITLVGMEDVYAADTYAWLSSLWEAENAYLGLLTAGWTAQQARSVLPNSLKTEIKMTANLREWRHFFKLRTHKAAHPQMREIAIPLLQDLQVQIPVIFEDIKP